MINKYSPKNESVKFEDFKPNKTFAFNINPCDRLQHWGDRERILKVYNWMKRQLGDIPYIAYNLYMELSPTGRLHFHGYIRTSNPKKFISDDFYRLIDNCTIIIKEITDFEWWENYCIKQCAAMKVTVLTKLYDSDYPKKMSIDDLCNYNL